MLRRQHGGGGQLHQVALVGHGGEQRGCVHLDHVLGQDAVQQAADQLLPGQPGGVRQRQGHVGAAGLEGRHIGRIQQAQPQRALLLRTLRQGLTHIPWGEVSAAVSGVSISSPYCRLPACQGMKPVRPAPPEACSASN